MFRRFFAGVMLCSMILGMFCCSFGGDSHIVADPTAPGNQRPQVIPTGNGLPQVNINTPNGNGLSYNRYQQFDVERSGAILNNSTQDVQTQLGGWIERNPNLAGGSARLIVNEVNSSRPSHLGGFIEIAGQRADVVIANPSGISVGGSGFINANRATLTTGKPVIENGALSGFDVRGGHIDISGNGLNNKQSNFTDIIADSVSVNAKIHADRELNIVAGKNFVTPDTRGVTRLNPDEETGVSVDVSVLGGMYAGQIRLIGTGRGVGVNSIQNAGEIAAGVGEVYISADGRLMNSNAISGKDGVRIDVEDDVANRGAINSGSDLSVEALGNIVNTGAIESAENASIQSEENSIYNTDTAAMLSGGDMNIGAGANLSNDGTVTVGGELTAVVKDIVQNRGEILADGIDLASDSLHNTGAIDATEVLLKSGEIYNVDSGSVFGDHIAIEAKTIVNGASAYTGHAPITHTQYDPVTNTYSYRDDVMADYGDSSEGFDYTQAIPDMEEEFEFGEAVGEEPEEGLEGREPPASEYDPADDEFAETEVGVGESEDFNYDQQVGRKTQTGNAGMIAARDRLDIGFSDLLFNRDDGLILSGGDMRIGGALDENRHAVGTGGILDNHSATIDAGGDLYMDVAELENLNAHYTTEERLIFQGNYTGYRFSGDPKVYIAGIDRIVKGKTKRGAWKISYPRDAEDFYQYSINRKIYDQFIIESRPAYITSGGDIRIAGTVTNNRSEIIAGDLLSINGNLTNIRAEEAQVTRDTGSIQWTWVESAGTFGNKHKRKYSYAGAYNPAPVFDWSERDITLFGDPDIAQPGANPMSAVLDAIANSNIASTGGLNGNLWGVNTAPDALHIVESDPRFANYRNWLSSDYMVKRLSADPQIILKRLGDGYYEQRLIRDQIVNKTGLRYLKGYSSDEEQYKALMTAGVEFAEEYELEIGVKLSDEMMKNLTTDIVWLEYVTVETPDGPVRALVPVVYLAPGREILLAENGGMVSGREVEIKGELRNAGNILGDSVALSGNDLNNSGTIAGGLVSMAAVRDIVNNGGAIIGEKGVELTAGRDITIASTTETTTSENGSRTEISKIGGVYVTGEEGHLSAQAGRDVNLKAADVNSAGTLDLAAGNDLNIGGVAIEYEHKTGANGNYLHDKTSEDIGSTVSASGDMTLSAGRDANITGSYVLGDGEIRVEAGRDVAITEGRSESYHETKSHEESSGFFSSKTKDTHNKDYENSAIGSELSGNTVVIESGNDFTLRGSTVAASNGASVEAGGDITITVADASSSSSSYKKETRDGFSGSFGGGSIGISYGSSEKGRETKDDSDYHVGSLIGSENGDVTLYAGKDVDIESSQVVAGTGDVAISGENVTIENTYDTYDHYEREYSKESSIGISVGLAGSAADAATGLANAGRTIEKAGNASSDRAGILYGIAGGREAYDAVKGAVGVATGGNPLGDLGLSISLGASSSSSEYTSTSHDEVVTGSSIISGGDTTIVARGEDGREGTGDLSIIGSTVDAGGDVLLAANDDITLKSAEESGSYADSNKNSSSGMGVTVGIGAGGINNIGVNANASKGKGSGSGNTGSHVESVIRGDNVEFASVDDTTIKGGQIIGDSVVGTVGGDLTIISEQDSESHDRKQSSSGGGISVGMGIGGGLANVGGSYSSQTQKGKSDYDSVDEQSGIFAGEGGFDITVGGNTGLVGAVIASEADPEDNLLVTGSLTTRDIENNSSYEATTKGMGGEFSYEKNGNAKSETANKGSISPSLPMTEEGDDSSNTKSAISEGLVVITDEDAQLAKTGQTAEEAVESLNRDTDNAHEGALDRNPGLQEIFDKQAELVEASAAAGKAVAKTIGDISQSMYEKTGDDGWKEGGAYKTILQGLGAGLVAQLGNGQGLDAALGAMASQLAAGKVGELARELASQVSDDPKMQELVTNIISNIISSGIGAAVGGESGANLAATMDRWNRQIHPNEINWIYANAEILLKEYNENKPDSFPYIESVEEFIAILGKEGLIAIDTTQEGLLTGKGDFNAYDPSIIKGYLEGAQDPNGNKLFSADIDERNDYSLGWDLLHDAWMGLPNENYAKFLNDTDRAYHDALVPFLQRLNAAQSGLPLKDQKFHVLNGPYIVIFDGYGKRVGGMDSGIVTESGSPLDLLVPWVGVKVGAATGKAIQGALNIRNTVTTGNIIGKKIVYSPMTQEGPLSQYVQNSFRSGTYTEVTLEKPVTLYRIWGGKADELGGYWTAIKPSGPLQSTIDNAIMPKWGNALTNVSKITVPPGTKIYHGFSASQGNGLLGGGSQIYIPDVNSKWLIK